MGIVYQKALKFKKRYPLTIGWRLRQNSAIVEKHLNPGEKVLYVFVCISLYFILHNNKSSSNNFISSNLSFIVLL